jgi:hypothetical protein
MVDAEVGVANGLCGLGVDLRNDQNAVVHCQDVVVVRRPAVPPDHQGGNLDAAEVLDDDT